MPILDVIKFEGDNSAFIWKHPAEDFNTQSQLIVQESQEAILFKDGQALDTFGPGRHTLSTNNIPILGSIVKLVTGGVSPFHCQVYFINKNVHMSIKWGTDHRVRFLDPLTGVPLDIGAAGTMNLEVDDGRKLLLKLVGTQNGIAWNDRAGFAKSLENAFWPMISTSVKSNLSRAIVDQKIDILEIDSHLEDLSKELGSRVEKGFLEYGLKIPQFYISTVSLPESDPNFKRIRDLHANDFAKRSAFMDAELKRAHILADREVALTEAESDADITRARRAAILEQQETKNAVAEQEAKRRVIGAQAEGEEIRAKGFADADVMKAQGYSKKDEFQRDVQQSFAESLGKAGGANTGSSIASDIASFGMAAGAVNSMMPQFYNSMQGFGGQWGQNQPAPGAPNQDTTAVGNQAAPEAPAAAANAPAGAPSGTPAKDAGQSSGASAPAAVPSDLTPVAEEQDSVTAEVSQPKGQAENAKENSPAEQKPTQASICSNCGAELVPGAKFCFECGTPVVRRCPSCGEEVPPKWKFCPYCGDKL